MSYKVSPSNLPEDFRILVVGCGGTGSFVAEGLCRLLDQNKQILLIDHDRVEPHNLRRQNFFEGDLGRFKSEALAKRLARLYGRKIGFSVYPFDRDLLGESWGAGMYTKVVHGLIIGCVDDSTAARREIARCTQLGNWWIDSGNSRDSGQVLIGDVSNVESMLGSFHEDTMEVMHLPMPSMQVPSILAPPARTKKKQMDCAEAIDAEEQSPVINQAMATLVLECVNRFLEGTLDWMAAYLDLGNGTMQTIPIEPVTIARMFSVKVDTLFWAFKCSKGPYYSMLPRR